MRLLFFSATAATIVTVFHGCDDDSDPVTTIAPETTVSASTDAVVTVVDTTQSPPKTCGGTSPEGFASIETEERDGGMVITSTRCDKYSSFNDFMLNTKVYEHGTGALVIMELIAFELVKVKLGDSVHSGEQISEKAAEGNEAVVERIRAGFGMRFAREMDYVNWLKHRYGDMAEAELFAKHRESADGGDKVAVKDLLSNFVVDLKLKEIVFSECMNLLHYVGGAFMSQFNKVDAFCNPEAQSIADGTECALGPDPDHTVAKLEARNGGWTVRKAFCHEKENDQVAQQINEGLAYYQPGSFSNDVMIHRISCEDLNRGAGKVVGEMVVKGCILMPGDCQYMSENEHFSLTEMWDREVADEYVKRATIDSYELKYIDHGAHDEVMKEVMETLKGMLAQLLESLEGMPELKEFLGGEIPDITSLDAEAKKALEEQLKTFLSQQVSEIESLDADTKKALEAQLKSLEGDVHEGPGNMGEAPPSGGSSDFFGGFDGGKFAMKVGHRDADGDHGGKGDSHGDGDGDHSKDEPVSPIAAYKVSRMSCAAYPTFFAEVRDLPLPGLSDAIELVKHFLTEFAETLGDVGDGVPFGNFTDQITDAVNNASEVLDENLSKLVDGNQTDFGQIPEDVAHAFHEVHTLRNASFHSCGETIEFLTFLLGHSLDDFCNPAKREAASSRPDETCSLISHDNKLAVNLTLTSGVWGAATASCSGVENEAAKNTVADFFAKKTAGTVMGDVYQRATCEDFRRISFVRIISHNCTSAAATTAAPSLLLV